MLLRRSQDDLPRLARQLEGNAERIRHRLVVAVMCFSALAMGTMGGDWATSIEFLGWPLVSVVDYELAGMMPVLVEDASSAWISIGIRPTGLVAVGAQPTGIFALGLVPIGVVPVGSVALGLAPIGSISVGWLSFGRWVSAGWYALADLPGRGIAIGAFAWGGRTRGLLYEARATTGLGAWPANEAGRSPMSARRQGELPRLASRLDGPAAARLRCSVLWAGIVASAVAVAASPLALWEAVASTEVLGWPLVAVGGSYEYVGGFWAFAGDEPRGWVSIGWRPKGLVAIGLQPTGVIAVGFLPVGVVSVGWMALGLLAWAGCAAAVVSYGVLSAGWIAFGRVSVGWHAHGRVAIGAYARGHRAYGVRLASSHPIQGLPEPAVAKLLLRRDRNPRGNDSEPERSNCGSGEK